MASPIVLRLRNLIQRTTAWITFRDARTVRWAAQAFSGKRTLWHRARLSVAAAQLEKCFLHVSQALERFAGRSSSLVQNSRTLLSYSLGLDGDTQVFQSALDMIERPLDFNDACLEVTAKVNQDLAHVAGQIGRLDRFRENLANSIAPLKILQTMFRIESASSPPEILSLFASLSAEIETLMEQMATLIAREFEAIENTGATIGSVAAQVRALHARQVEAGGRRAEIHESVAALEIQIEAGKARDKSLIGAAEAMSREIAAMVGSLQYQDILNQRLQHVIEGLAEIAEQSQRLGDSVSPARRADTLCFLRDASRVESAQLEGVEEALASAIVRLRIALEGLARQAHDLGGTRLQQGGIPEDGSAVDGLVRVLLDTIRENTELIESTSAQACAISTALEPIGGLLGNLTGSILSLSARIRLISLNAQIQAAQAGAGTGLEVLACRARTIAEEIVVEVADLAGVLSNLKQQLKISLEEAASMHHRSIEFLRLLREDGADQACRLKKFQSRMAGTRMAVADQIRQFQAEAIDLAGSLDGCSAVRDAIGRACSELVSFSQGLSLRLLYERGKSRVEDLARAYTAAAERSVHDRALEIGPTLPLVSCAVNSPASAEGSVELF